MKLDAIIHKSPTNSFAEAAVLNDRAIVHSFSFPIEEGWEARVRESLRKEYRSQLRSVKFRAGTHSPITKGLT